MKYGKHERLGIGLMDCVFLITQTVFLVLKLTRQIDWSWFWVLSPLLVVAALIVMVLLFCVIVYLVGRKGE